MQIARWYVQRFSDSELYFLPLAEQKNGGFSGKLMRVDLLRPRASVKAKKSSVRTGPHGSAGHWSVLWRPIVAQDVPVKVLEAAAD